MTLIHVHIIPAGRRFNLRVGMFKSFVGWQTAEAASLPVPTRRTDGTAIWNCLDNLTRKKAEELAPKLDEWLLSVGAFQPPSQRRVTAKQSRMGDLEAKYQQAMGAGATKGGSRFT